MADLKTVNDNYPNGEMGNTHSSKLMHLRQAIGNKYAKNASECTPVYVFQNSDCFNAFQTIWFRDGAPDMPKQPFILDDDLFNALKDEGFQELPENYSQYGKSPVIVVYDDLEKIEIKKLEDSLRDARIEVYLQAVNQCDRIIYETTSEAIRNAISRQYSEVYSGASYMDEFLADIADQDKNQPVSTGFPSFDRALDGGIYPDLYVFGGGTGSGKTTFALNLAVNMSIQGHHVLIIALEMSRKELFAKMISSHSYAGCEALGVKPENFAQSTRNILKGGKFNESKEDRLIRENAINSFKRSIAPNIYIHESIGKCTIKSIKKEVDDHIRHTGVKPIVFIDYLQILSHEDKFIRTNDKVKTDENILGLKQLSRDYSIPIFILSSLNRETYKDMSQEVTLTSFKESGAIEYSGAVVLGMQLSIVTDLAIAKSKKDTSLVKDLESRLRDEIESNPRLQDVRVLKNRHDGFKGTIRFMFHGECNRFVEIERVNTKKNVWDVKPTFDDE